MADVQNSSISTYQWLKSKGICVRCGRNKAFYTFTMCPDCMEKERLRKAEQYKKRTTEQVANQNRRRQVIREERKAKGLCPYCGKPVQPGAASCTEHLLYYRKRYQKIGKPNGECCKCDRKVVNGYKVCSYHLEQCRRALQVARDRAKSKGYRWRAVDDGWKLRNAEKEQSA